MRALFALALLVWQDTKVEPVKVPYRISDANHIAVRAKINGKGPFNFIIDTGAPALFITVKTAKEIGLEPDDKKWAKVDKFTVEGGAELSDVRARIEDPFQLQGMAAMGMKLDGIIGYNTVARFKIELDATKRTMLWTKLDFAPPEPPDAKELFGDNPPDSAQQKQMEMLAKMMAQLMGAGGKTEPRGYIGIELDEGVAVTAVYEKSPAAEAGIQKGDVIVAFKGKKVATLEALLKMGAAAGEEITIKVKRGDEEKEIAVKVGKGL